MRLLAAIVIVLLAFFLRQALAHGSPEFPPYVTFYPAVVLAALLGDFWAGILATALSAFLVDYFILPPIGQLTILGPTDLTGFALFCFSGIAISVATELYRRSQKRLAAYQVQAAVLDERRKMNPAREAADASETQLESNLGRRHGTEPKEGENVSTLVRRTVLIPVIALVFLAAAFLGQILSMRSSMQWVDHTDQVIGTDRELLNLEIDMETGLRGYLNTGSEAFLQPYNNANLSIDSNFDQLRQLVSDNPGQQAKLADIRSQFNQWRLDAQSTIELRRNSNTSMDYESFFQRKRLMDSIRASHHAFTATEEQLRDERVRSAERMTRLVIVTSLLLALGIGAFLAVLTRLSMRLIAARFQELLDLAEKRTEESKEAAQALQESEKTLRQSQEWLRVTLGSIGDAVLAADTEGRVTFLNPAAATLTGWNADEAQGRPVQEVFRIVNEKTQEAAEDIVAHVLREGHAAELANHTAMVARNGAVTPIEDSAAPILNSAGEVIGVVLVFRDVTVRRRAQEAQRYLSAIVESSDDAIIGKSLNGVITSWNRGAAHQYGYTAAEAIGKSISILIPADHPNEMQDFLQRVGAGGKVDRYQSKRLRKDGSLLDVSLTISPIFDTTGGIVGASTIAHDITERKRAEIELRAREERLRLAGDAAQLGIFEWTVPTDTAVWENKRMYEIFGIPETTDPVNRDRFVQETLHPEDLQRFTRELEEAMQPGALFRGAYRIRRMNGGQWRWIQYFARFELTPDGKPLRLLGVLEDVTEAKQAEQRLAHVASFPELNPKPIIETDLEGNVTYANPAAQKLFPGHLASCASSPLLRDWASMIAGFTTGAEKIVTREVEAEGSVLEQTIHYIPALGRVRAYFSDITERKRAEEFRQSSQYARSLLEASLDPLVTISPEGKITDVNEAAIKVTGVARDKLVGTDFADYFTEPDKAREGYQRVFSEGFVTDYPLTIRHADGRLTEVLYNASVYKDDRNNVLGVFAAARDVTDLKRAEAELAARARELARSNADLQQFAYVASHDLQEPLRTISSFSQLLARRYQGKLDADADDFIAFMVDGAMRMQTLINDLLAFSRIGTQGSSFAPTDCEKILHSAEENLKAAIEESGAVITHDSLPRLVADERQLTQLFQNLLSNAIKFRRPEIAPRIHVSSKRQNGAWKLSIRDNGIGIDPHYFDRIFIIFQRLHGREQYTGTGIGLAICKKIVERHGGRLWVESESGTGSIFHFVIPGESNIGGGSLYDESRQRN